MKKKYKRLVAAVAGAAVISSAMLPGLPASKAYASSGPTVTHSQVTKADWYATSDDPLRAAKQYAEEAGFDLSRDTVSLDNQTSRDAVAYVHSETGAIYKIYLTKSGSAWTVKRMSKIGFSDRQYHGDSNPVSVVKKYASRFGFDADSDRFSLLSSTGGKAIVQVRSGGRTYKVDLVKDGNSWDIKAIRGIGDMNHPATYTPASLFDYDDDVVTAPQQQNTIFNSKKYQDWDWQETTYPRDMSFGVFVSKFTGNDAPVYIPDNVRNDINKLDFHNRFVLYANLGKVADLGYGIGIQRVVQKDNDITVVVKTKSPAQGERTASKKYDYITLDRSLLTYDSPLYITFVDQDGTVLSKYRITSR